MSAIRIEFKKLLSSHAGKQAVVLRDGVALKGHLYLVNMTLETDPVGADHEWYLQRSVPKLSGIVMESMPIKSTDDVYVSSPARCHRCREGARKLCVFCFGGYL